MDLKKILGSLENSDELIKQINEEIGKEFVSRADFNKKNEEYKSISKQLEEQSEEFEGFKNSKGTMDKTIEELTNKVKGYELNSLKTKVAFENGIPFNMVSRLQGDDEESIKKDAQSLAEYFKSQQPTPPLKHSEPQVSSEETAYKSMLNNLTNKGE